MKKHIIGFTIFAFIVGSFVSIWSVFGYFTQTIPNIPAVQTEKVPVFKSDRRTSCFKQQREKISYEVIDSYYFSEGNEIVSTLKIKWNGYGAPPKNIFVKTKLFTDGNKFFSNGGETTLKNVFEANDNVFVTVRSFPLQSFRGNLSENFYADFDFSTDSDASLTYKKLFAPKQIIIVHGESSISKQQ